MDRAVILTASLLAVATAGLLLACTSPKGGSPEGSAPPPTQEAVLARTATPTPAEIPYVVQRDVTYCSPGGIAQKLDIFSPASREGKAAPAVIYLHGGAWIQGDKGTGVWLAPLVGRLVQEGYVVAAVNYRLAPAHRWPAQIEDAKCAVRYLRANASILGLDSGKIGVIGVSAGGHLAALLGTTCPNAGLEGNGGYAEQSSRVQAVVDIAGPTDLTLPEFSSAQAQVASEVFGATAPQDPVLKQASPVNYVSKGDPPFLILHGEKDTLVPVHQAEELNDRLIQAGVPSTLVVVRNGGHTLSSTGGPTVPSQEQIAALMISFLGSHLKG